MFRPKKCLHSLFSLEALLSSFAFSANPQAPSEVSADQMAKRPFTVADEIELQSSAAPILGEKNQCNSPRTGITL